MDELIKQVGFWAMIIGAFGLVVYGCWMDYKHRDNRGGYKYSIKGEDDRFKL